MFVSYKKTRGIPNEAAVVAFHGHPRPHEVTEGWVPKVWKVGGLSHAELKKVINTAQEALFSNVRSACARNLAWFDAQNDEHDRHVAIIGGGPSVRRMLPEIFWRKSIGQDVWVLNNAGVVLADLEIEAQLLLDARPENLAFVRPAKEYLIASQCAPEVFEAAGTARTTLWHANSPGMAELLKDEKARVTYLIGGGSTVGMNALALAISRGYRKIHLYGFDSSYDDDQHHAYPQTLNDSDPITDVLYGDKHYKCAPWMVGQANEFAELAPGYEADGVVITVHGHGLLPDIAADLRQTMSPAEVRAHEILKRFAHGQELVGAEIGVFAGELSRALLMGCEDLSLLMIDSWEGHGAAYRDGSGDFHAGLPQIAQDDFYCRAQKRVTFAGKRATIMRERSDAAVFRFANHSLDFVFIDADHSYDGCRADIYDWRRKIKPGGWLCGHDYQNHAFPQFGVTRAVDEFVSRHALNLETGENFCWFVQLPTEKQDAA